MKGEAVSLVDVETALAFSVFENPGVYALLIGSGVSRGSGVPTGWEITLDLVRRVAMGSGTKEQADWNKWYAKTYAGEPDYGKLLDELSPTADERRSILHRYIEQIPGDIATGPRLPSRAHHAIANLVKLGFVRVIITTNFDRLLENALREAGVEPTVIASDDDIKGSVPLIHSKCFVMKVHGDYHDTRIRNTSAELASYSKPLNTLLDRILDEHGLIVCGWSGEWDQALRSAIVRAPNRRYPLFWAVRGEPKEPAIEVANKRSGRFVRIKDADSFFDGLSEKVTLQIELQRPNPRSIDLLVAETKRYLRTPESKIQLHDLIGREVKTLNEVLPAADKTTRIQTKEDFVSWVEREEAALEPLARIFGVLGRWGDEPETELALRIIESFTRLPLASGYTNLIGLREYPAVVLAYAFGLGSYASGNLKQVQRLFSLPITDQPRGGQRRFIENHFLDAWDGAGQNSMWTHLPEFGGQKHRAALSFHLHTLFSVWTKDYEYTGTDFSLTFHGFELLAGLTIIVNNATTASLSAALGDSQPQSWIWTPLGCAMWEEAARNEILGRWATAEGADGLLKAGLAAGDSELPKLSLRHLVQQIERRRIFPF